MAGSYRGDRPYHRGCFGSIETGQRCLDGAAFMYKFFPDPACFEDESLDPAAIREQVTSPAAGVDPALESILRGETFPGGVTGGTGCFPVYVLVYGPPA